MRIKKRTGDRIFKIVAVLFVTLFALICLYPLMMVVSVSFSNETEVLLNGYSVFPQAPTLQLRGDDFHHGGRHNRLVACHQYVRVCALYQKAALPECHCLSVQFHDRIFRRACPVVLHLHQCPAPEKQRVVADYTQPVQCLEYVPDADLSFPGSICTI